MPIRAIIFILFGLFVFLGFNRHRLDDYKSYRGIIWADAAGYYVYNPLWFKFKGKLPKGIDLIIAQTGNGFSIDKMKNRISTKYTSGVAILQAPFYLAADYLAPFLGFKNDGFSPIYHWAILIAGLFYGFLGLVFSYFFLRVNFSAWISLVTLFSFLGGTNLYYYIFDNAGMSHVYSFFLFSLVLWVAFARNFMESTFLKVVFVFGISLSTLIRPTSILFCSAICFILYFKKVNLTLKKRDWFLFLIPFLVWLPQILFWKSIKGAFLIDSYPDESFIYLTSPKIFLFLFSPNNGMIVYAPILIFSIWGIFKMIMAKSGFGWIVGLTLLANIYLSSSWWCWWFGCAFGARTIVEYYSLLVLPFAFLLNQLQRKSHYLIICVIGTFVFLNIYKIYHYYGCFIWETWDWVHFFEPWKGLLI